MLSGLIKKLIEKNEGRGFSQETASFERFGDGPDVLSLFDVEQHDSGAAGRRGAALPNEPGPAAEDPGQADDGGRFKEGPNRAHRSRVRRGRLEESGRPISG